MSVLALRVDTFSTDHKPGTVSIFMKGSIPFVGTALPKRSIIDSVLSFETWATSGYNGCCNFYP